MAEEFVPLVIAIGGSDPGAGAGIQADAEMAARMGAECFAAPTMHTDQGPAGLTALQLVDPAVLREQLAKALVLLAGRRQVAVKTGALGSAALVREVVHFLDRCPMVNLVVDPVRHASRSKPGVAALLDEGGWQHLCAELLPRARLVTPNLREWPALTPQQWGCALRKGGHRFDASDVSLENRRAVDHLMWNGEVVERFESAWIDGADALHGTGCRLASAVAIELARQQIEGAETTRAELIRAIAQARMALVDWMRHALGASN